MVYAPLRTPIWEIERIVERHDPWVQKHMDLIAALPPQKTLSDEERGQLIKKALITLPPRVAHFAEVMGLTPTGIRITGAVKRWGSCSGKNSLNFPYRLMLLPPELMDYIIVHELAHIREKNHGPGFYRVIEQFMPDYRERTRQLKALERQLPL